MKWGTFKQTRNSRDSQQTLEDNYQTLLGVVSEPEKNKKELAKLLNSAGYKEVSPEDFVGARLGTGPKDRPYLKDKYGLTFYPSTIYILSEKWDGSNNCNGLAYPKVICKKFSLKFLNACEEKDFHEDFHELFNLYNDIANMDYIDYVILNELHSFHVDIDTRKLFFWSEVYSVFTDFRETSFLSHYFANSKIRIKEFFPKLHTLQDLCENIEALHPDDPSSPESIKRYSGKNYLSCSELEELLITPKSLKDLNEKLKEIIEQRGHV